MPNVPGTAIRRLGSCMSSLDNACLALKEIRFCPLRSALMQCSGVGADVCCSPPPACSVMAGGRRWSILPHRLNPGAKA